MFFTTIEQYKSVFALDHFMVYRIIFGSLDNWFWLVSGRISKNLGAIDDISRKIVWIYLKNS
jgi:hypothetical protein